MKKSEILERLRQLEEKYFALVWFARTSPNCLKEDHISTPHYIRIKMSMPEDCNKLAGPESDWHHGFNSGCLAAFRLVSGLMSTESNAKLAEESFPFIDT
jgi:hypothetical protein